MAGGEPGWVQMPGLVEGMDGLGAGLSLPPASRLQKRRPFSDSTAKLKRTLPCQAYVNRGENL